MLFNVGDIKKASSENFEKAWVETAKLIPRNTCVEINKEKGNPHPVRDMIQRLRTILLEMGFDEVENRTILPESDVYKEYGPEAPVILDRAFYLAKMPRPDIGLSEERTARVEKIIGKKFDPMVLQNILRSYKKGNIEGDDFVEELVKRMRIRTEQATDILDKVFSEFKKLKPYTTTQTLRSHMSGAWYATLAALQETASHPLVLFSVAPRYRNEQKEDKGHLRVHHSASVVVMDPTMSLEAGRKITEEILKKCGFEAVKFETKKATSKYYAMNQEQEVFAKHMGGKWLEIGDIGMYSVVSLANFGIKYPVFNAGFGIERLAMILHNYEDIRKLVYPQFSVAEYTDEEIAKSISYIHEPETERGERIAEAIEATARKRKDESAPCEFTAYEDDQVLVKIVEREEGKRLIGPAGFNKIYVENGNICARGRECGVCAGADTNINYMKAAAKGIAWEIEKSEEPSFSSRFKIVKSLSNLNLMIPKSINLYIESNNKKIELYGPMFLEVVVEYKKSGGG